MANGQPLRRATGILFVGSITSGLIGTGLTRIIVDALEPRHCAAETCQSIK